jgi:hypothetical protein
VDHLPFVGGYFGLKPSHDSIQTGSKLEGHINHPLLIP